MMAVKIVVLLLTFELFVTVSVQASSPQSGSYVAAVVEYAPVSGATLENKEQIFMQNVANYMRFMEEAARQSVDIIVFPEAGLASMGVPQNPDGTPSLAFFVPAAGFNPCTDSSSNIAQGLRDLSCGARINALYVVLNLPEKVICDSVNSTIRNAEECPSTGAFFHNTNVVFDRNGTIVGRYRKFNLYNEPGFVPTQKPEHVIFETDFGVRFGTFICFDIMFEEPAVVLARTYGVCDFTFPTAWFSEAPFLTAVQTQAAWSYALDVNLLGAGYNRPEVGSAGSGIYLGRSGTLRSVMPNVTTSRMLVGTVPKKQRCAGTAASELHVSERSATEERNVSIDDTRNCKQGETRDASSPELVDGASVRNRVNTFTAGILLKRDHLDVYQTLPLSSGEGRHVRTVDLCDGTFCCEFDVISETRGSGPHYNYRLAVFNGVRTFDGFATGGVQVCAVIPCAADDLASCGRLTLPDEAVAETVFHRIVIAGSFKSNHTLITADTLQTGLLQLPADKFSMTSQLIGDGLSQVTMEINGSTEGVSLLTFAIYSRVYERDGQPETTDNN